VHGGAFASAPADVLEPFLGGLVVVERVSAQALAGDALEDRAGEDSVVLGNHPHDVVECSAWCTVR
jgi:hypothetical protein